MIKKILLIFCVLILTLNAGKAAESVNVLVDDNLVTIKISDVYANCCSSFQPEFSISGNTVVLLYRDTSSQKCRCMCNYDLSYAISQIPKGDYNLVVNREELKRYGYPDDAVVNISKTKFKVEKDHSKNPLGYDFRQSPCKSSSPEQHKRSTREVRQEVEVFPNPANSVVTIKFDLRTDSDVSIKITNILGKEILAINKSNLQEGLQTISFDVSELPAGIYIGKITSSEGQINSFKMLWSK